jgi:hypothetical protein
MLFLQKKFGDIVKVDPISDALLLEDLTLERLLVGEF